MTRHNTFFRTLLTCIAVAVALAACGSATNPPTTRSGVPTISDAWVRAVQSGSNNISASYMTITSGGEADRLLTISTSLAEAVELHSAVSNDGVISMQPIEEGIAVPPGGSVELKPGGFHAMLIGLKKDLRLGETVDLQLTFERAGEVVVKAQVRER